MAVLIPGLLSQSSHAQTTDGITPAEEMVCDELTGRAFGLCNAYCEALDCDVREQNLLAPLPECDALRNNYMKLTASSVFPCDASCPAAPVQCSGNGVLGTDADGCQVCVCYLGWAGVECATCEAGFDECGVCGGYATECEF